MHLWAVWITGNIHIGRDGNKSISSYAFLLILLYARQFDSAHGLDIIKTKEL